MSISLQTHTLGVERIEDLVSRHRQPALRLARWLLRNDDDAEDAVQDACLRAFRYYATFQGGNARAWFLRIVRNCCHLRRRAIIRSAGDLFDEDHHDDGRGHVTPESMLIGRDRAAAVDAALRTLPESARLLLILREVRGLSYRELAKATATPIGTVMSRLSRARRALKRAIERRDPAMNYRSVA
jgi:RNA polymerase sigma-70 factor (ECF subfamily)